MSDDLTAPAVLALRHTTIQRFFEFRKVAPHLSEKPPITEHIIAADTILMGLPLAQHPEVTEQLLLIDGTTSNTNEAARVSLAVANFMMAKSAATFLVRLTDALDHHISTANEASRQLIRQCRKTLDSTDGLLADLERTDFVDHAACLRLMEQWPSLLLHINDLKDRYPIIREDFDTPTDSARTSVILVLFSAALIALLAFLIFLPK